MLGGDSGFSVSIFDNTLQPAENLSLRVHLK
jgi:hypothetical protein